MKKYDRGYDTPSDHNPQNRATSSKKQMRDDERRRVCQSGWFGFWGRSFFLLDRLADPVLSCPKFWCSGFRYTGLIYNISTCYWGLLIDTHDLPVDCNVALHITIVPGPGDCSWILRISTYNCPLVLATATADWYLLPSIDIWHCRLVLAKINCLIW